MSTQNVIHPAFNSGEWAPSLFARVDLQKWRTGAALLENFFVDYRGGASSRPGTRYCLQAWNSASPVRVIPFQASFTAGYLLEFGDFYMRPFYNGAPILETPISISGATKATPGVITVSQSWTVGDWIYIEGVGGMTELNGNFYRVNARTGTTVSLGDLNGNDVNTSSFGTYTSGGTAARIYTVTSPYAAGDLALLKFAQNVDRMIFCHPNYPPYELLLDTPDNWTFTKITFASGINPPSAPTASTSLGAGSVNYAYVVTSVTADGDESGPSTYATLASVEDLRDVFGTNTISWAAVSEAAQYNVYKAEPNYSGGVPVGAQFGYIGTTTGVEFIDSNIAPDYSQTPPVVRNPFFGSGVESVAIGTKGNYQTTPTVSFSSPGGGGVTARGTTIMELNSFTIANDGNDYQANDLVYLPGGIILQITNRTTSDGIAAAKIVNRGTIIGPVPVDPITVQGTKTGKGRNASINAAWRVKGVHITNPGTGYVSAPTVSFSSGAATATANLGASAKGNPSVPGFCQQRLWFANQAQAPQTFHASQPGSFYNFNVSSPLRADDAIEATLTAGLLNEIRSMVPQQAGMILLTNAAAWLVTGGQPGAAITPIDITDNPQSSIGVSHVPPIVVNHDILFVQSKGSAVRNMSYNFYTNVYTGEDISLISSHLFYGHTVLEWALAYEPYKLIWAVRDDGVLLSLTFIKEQEFIAWAHHETQGAFLSVASVTEYVDGTYVDAVYFVVSREINGNTVQYIERLAERSFPNGRVDAWCVDAGIKFTGTATTSFSGAQHLAGQTVTGLADGEVIPPFTMPASGNFTLSTAASNVVVGLPFTCRLQTLPLDLGEPTVQGKVKKIPAIDVRVVDTLGLKIGPDFDNLVTMKDLTAGRVGSMLTGLNPPQQVVTDLFTGDARTYINSGYTVLGQYCIQQDQPYPATILGVIPQITIGDVNK